MELYSRSTNSNPSDREASDGGTVPGIIVVA